MEILEKIINWLNTISIKIEGAKPHNRILLTPIVVLIEIISIPIYLIKVILELMFHKRYKVKSEDKEIEKLIRQNHQERPIFIINYEIENYNLNRISKQVPDENKPAYKIYNRGINQLLRENKIEISVDESYYILTKEFKKQLYKNKGSYIELKKNEFLKEQRENRLYYFEVVSKTIFPVLTLYLAWLAYDGSKTNKELNDEIKLLKDNYAALQQQLIEVQYKNQNKTMLSDTFNVKIIPQFNDTAK